MKTGVVGLWAVAAAALGGLVAPAMAQDVDAEVVATEAVVETQQEPAPAAVAAEMVTIPKLTPIVIEILDPLGSKTSKSLDSYRIRLAEPIVIEGVELVPAGAEGQGEVVHAKKAGGMGAAGELVLAARWLDIGGTQMRLRSMELIERGEGRDRTGTVNAINVASAASPLPIGLIGYFIGGGNIDIPAGALASAKLAADFQVPKPAVPATADPADMQPAQELSGPEGGTDVTEEGKPE